MTDAEKLEKIKIELKIVQTMGGFETYDEISSRIKPKFGYPGVAGTCDIKIRNLQSALKNIKQIIEGD